MIFYADLIFLLNGFIDFLLLWLTSGIRKQKVSIWRLVLAAIVGSVYSVLHLWPFFVFAYSFLMKILISMVMVWVAFGFRHPVAYLRNLGVFYVVCFITGGGVLALHYVMAGGSQVAGGILFTQPGGSPVSWLLVVGGFPLVWWYTRLSFRSLEERAWIGKHLIPVKVEVESHKMECTGLVDTGNQLRDPISRNPVMLVELTRLVDWIPEELQQLARDASMGETWENLPPSWITRIRVIPYRVAGRDSDLMVTFKPDRIEMLTEGKWHTASQTLIGIDVGQLSSDGTYQAIIHPSSLC